MQDGGATAIGPTPPIRRRQPRPLPFESAGDACSTYARPVDGAVLTESALAKTELKKVQIEQHEAWLKCMIRLVF